MILVLVDLNGERIDDRAWELKDAGAAMVALQSCCIPAHLAVRSNANETFVSAN